MPQLRRKILPAADKTMQPNNQLNEIFLKYDEIPRKERKCNYIKCSIKTKKKKKTGKGWKVKIRIKRKRALCPTHGEEVWAGGSSCSLQLPWTLDPLSLGWVCEAGSHGHPCPWLSLGSRCRGSMSSDTPQPSPHFTRAQAPPCPTMLQALGSGRPVWTGWAAGVWLGQSHRLQEQTGRKIDANLGHKKTLF